MQPIKTVFSSQPEFRTLIRGVEFPDNWSIRVVFNVEPLSPTLVTDQRPLDKSGTRAVRQAAIYLAGFSTLGCQLSIWNGTPPIFSGQYHQAKAIRQVDLSSTSNPGHTYRLASAINAYAQHVRQGVVVQPALPHPLGVFVVSSPIDLDGLEQELSSLSFDISYGTMPPMELLFLLVKWEPDERMGRVFDAIHALVPGKRPVRIAHGDCLFSVKHLVQSLKDEIPAYHCLKAEVIAEKQVRPAVFYGCMPQVYSAVLDGRMMFTLYQPSGPVCYLLNLEDIGVTVPILRDERHTYR